MGRLDETTFASTIERCAECGGRAFEMRTYIDRQTQVMLGERVDDGRWVHDGEKFIDGVYFVKCLTCGAEPFASSDCPRCHRANGLGDALDRPSRIAIGKRCPSCKCTEITVTGFAPASVRTGEAKRPSPTPLALFGEPSFHVAVAMCDGCDWIATAEGCPLCGGPGPLRARP